MLKCAQLCSLSPTPKSKVGLGQLCGDEHREQRGGAFKGRGTRVSKQETRDYLSPALNSCRSLVDRRDTDNAPDASCGFTQAPVEPGELGWPPAGRQYLSEGYTVG